MSRSRNLVPRAALVFACLASIALLAPPSPAEARKLAKPTVETLATRGTSTPASLERASAALTSERRRVTDEDIARDLATFDRWQRTLDSLSGADPRPSVYHLATAQGLVNLARQQYERGDRCGAVGAALDEGARLIERMRAGERDLPTGPPPILAASEFRPDLWQRAAELRGHAGFRCIEAQVARSESMLLSAAHETFERQPCDSTRLVAEAQALLDEARATAEACVARDAAPPPSPAINPRSPERRAVLLREIDLLPSYVRFELDSASVDPATVLILDLIADKLTKYTEIRVRLSGHAVSRASLAYNLLLSKQRAESVRLYLMQAGVADDRMDIEYYATPMPRAMGDKVDALARDHCVVFEYMVTGFDIVPGPEEAPQAPSPSKKKPRGKSGSGR